MIKAHRRRPELGTGRTPHDPDDTLRPPTYDSQEGGGRYRLLTLRGGVTTSALNDTVPRPDLGSGDGLRFGGSTRVGSVGLGSVRRLLSHFFLPTLSDSNPTKECVIITPMSTECVSPIY